MAPLFTLQHVWLSRDGVEVLRGVDVSLDETRTALLGPSGSGKSSLLRLLNRLADPTRGRVLFRMTDVREHDPIELRRRVVLVPQLPAPLAGSVAGDLAYGAALRGRSVAVPALLSRVGLDPAYASRATARLSVGEQQRVMLARALALEPEVLLLDEPTSALDEAARDAVEATILALPVPFVLVTHDRAQAERLATVVRHMEDIST
ncbi:MAG TPA: ATP-binding cassette domain-containing protein [Solirubrobacteraceae bacterium]|nr:ATP-binding cassette domain-containing protein [Solirubrobacteraceae bacterium]